jgi:uncharacterized membrane protein YdjX (TVP38/TMEM64 family)
VAEEPGQRRGLRRPSVDDFVFEGEEPPLFLLSWMLGLSTEVDAKPLRDWVDERGAWGPLLFIGFMALSVLFAPIPNAPVFIAAGLIWGPVVGTAYSMIGLLIGSAMAFYVSRWTGRRFLARLIGRKAAERLDNLAETMGGRVVFWARMLPAINFDWISFVAGFTAIRFWVFFLYSAAGMLLPTAVFVVAGDGLGSDIRKTLAAGGAWLFGIVASAVYFWQRRRRWRANNATAGPDPAPSRPLADAD